MGEFDFDRVFDRKNSGSYKWDGLPVGDDVIPMWVADMDFACPPCVVEAVVKRAQHPIYGYPLRTSRYYEAVEGWFKKRHGCVIPREYLAFAPPGVIYGMNIALKLLTKEGDRVLIHVPNYDPLFDIITRNNRKMITSKLLRQDGRYTMDFEDLERKAKEGLSALILTSPHNPTGRVWTREELERLSEICLRHDIFVLVDEIHADFTSAKNPHTAFIKFGEKALRKSMIFYSPNKGFNLGGFQMATAVTANEDLRKRFNEEMGTAQTRLDNIFGAEAMTAAYESGEEWLDAAIAYVDKNKVYVRDYLKDNIPEIRWTNTEGTYLGWLNCEGLGITGKELDEFMIKKAGIALSPGYEFGGDSESYMRINLACPKSLVEEALSRLSKAVDVWRKAH